MGFENRSNCDGSGWSRQGNSCYGLCSQRVSLCSPQTPPSPPPPSRLIANNGIVYSIRYQIATGSGDDTVRIWDLRALKTQYIIPAHKSSVADVKFFRSSSELPPVGIQGLPLSSRSAQVDGMDVDKSNDTEDKEKEEKLSRSGMFLVTAGFDCNVRIWSADEWNMVRNLSTDAGKVMSVDVSGDGKFVASASYSRSFHLFGGENSL